MIDKPEPPLIIPVELTEHGPSKYQGLVIHLCEALDAKAVAIVVIGGPFGTGGSSAARSVDAMQQLPAMLRRVAESQAKQLP